MEPVYIGSLVWNVCSSIYLVYKFTSFFSWIYNTFVIMKKIKNGLCWTKNKFLGFTKRYTKTTNSQDEDELLNNGHYTELTEIVYYPKDDNENDKMSFSKFINKEKIKECNNLTESNLLIEKIPFGVKESLFLNESEENIPPFSNQLSESNLLIEEMMPQK